MKLFIGGADVGHFFEAGDAPCGPEIHEDHFAAEFREIDFAAVGGTTFLDGVREVVGLERSPPPEPKVVARAPVSVRDEATPANGDVTEAVLRLLEALSVGESWKNLTPAQKSRVRVLLGLMAGDEGHE